MRKIDIEKINTGDIVMTSGTTDLSLLIQTFQGMEDATYGKLSHSGTAWWCYGKLFLIEMQEPGLIPTDFVEHYCNDNFKSIIVLKPKAPIDGVEYGKIMLKYLGRVRYDFVNLLALQPIKIIFHKFLGCSTQKNKRWICHEATASLQNKYFESVGVGTIFDKETAVNGVDLCRSEFYDHYTFK